MCKYCEKEFEERKSIKTFSMPLLGRKYGCSLDVDIYIDDEENTLKIFRNAVLCGEGGAGECDTVRIAYCPMCGRKLIGE